MIIIDIEAAGPRLSELIEEAGAGEEILISRDGEPLAKLVPVPRPTPKREVDAPREATVISHELLTPLSDDELRAWLQ
jgi:prevent-host-death family protein